MKQHEIVNLIKKSTKHLCLHCNSRNCSRSHSISKEMYLEEISEDGHVVGNFRNKGVINFDKISVNYASTFYNFCNSCDKVFKPLDDYKLDINNKEQIFLLYYRILAAQVHQCIEEYHFYNSVCTQNKDNLFLYDYNLFVKNLLLKLFELRSELNKKNFSSIISKTIILNKKIDFVYFNTISINYDLKLNKIEGNPLLNINIFFQDDITKIILTWEEKYNEVFCDYINQISMQNKEKIENYFSNIMISFPMNLYFRPSVFFRWNKRDCFNNVKNLLQIVKNINIENLYKIINNEATFNLFKLEI